ncbi:hypothetical protein D3C85_1823400 [compost metagenome]
MGQWTRILFRSIAGGFTEFTVDRIKLVKSRASIELCLAFAFLPLNASEVNHELDKAFMVACFAKATNSLG